MLKIGSRGSEVKKLQESLVNNNYNPGIIDGIFGTKTKNATIAFQKDNGLARDGIVGPKTEAILYGVDSNSSHSLKSHGKLKYVVVNPNDIAMIVANKKLEGTTSKTLINGTFFWQGNPNGIIVSGGKTLCPISSHNWRGYPQSVLYWDGKNIGVKRVKTAAELGSVVWAIGGCGMITPYGYSPTGEGFNGVNADILRTTNKTVIGAKGGSVYLITANNISHGSLLVLLKELKLDVAVSLDGGGSSCMRVNGKTILKTDGRTVNNWVVIK